MSTQRIDELESELKILKNEIQTMLIDVREHVLSYYKNPFQMVNVQAPKGDPETEVTANVGGGGVAGATEQIVEKSVPVKATEELGGGASMEATPEGSSQLKALMDQLERERQALNQESSDRLAAPGQFSPSAMSAESPADQPSIGSMGSPGTGGFGGYGTPGVGSGQPSQDMLGFQTVSDGMPGTDFSMPMEGSRSAGPGTRPGSGRTGRPGGKKSDREEEPWFAGKRGDRPGSGKPGSSRRSNDSDIESHAQDEEADQHSPAPNKDVNLLTLVGLVRWVEKSVKKIGKEKVEAIVEIYRTAGYLPENYNKVIEQVMRLAEGEKPGGPVTIGHSISVLLELDGLMGGKFQTESSILSTIFTEDGGDPWIKR